MDITDQRKTILVTGFEPFGRQEKNASWEAVRLLPDEIGGCPVVKVLLPVVFGKAAEITLEEIRRTQASLVFLVGEAGGRSLVTPETAARNCRKDLADNAGYIPKKGEMVLSDGPAILRTKLKVEEIVQQMKDMPIAVSEDAGSYVCNDLFYLVLSALKDTDILVDFIHVPYSEGQNERESCGADGLPMEVPVLASEKTAAVLERFIGLVVA